MSSFGYVVERFFFYLFAYIFADLILTMSLFDMYNFDTTTLFTTMYCTKCGKLINDNAPQCPYCGQTYATSAQPIIVQAAEKKNSCTSKGCAFLAATVVGLGIFGALLSDANKQIEETLAEEQSLLEGAINTEKNATTDIAKPAPTANKPKSVVNKMAAAFAGDCGIEATAHMKNNQYVNHPELTINIANESGKNIAAIKFLAIPYDVYGEEIKSFATQKGLFTDDMIKAGASKKLSYGPFLLQNIKSVKLYVYSVYFTDGSKWGDKDASERDAIRYGKQIDVTFER